MIQNPLQESNQKPTDDPRLAILATLASVVTQDELIPIINRACEIFDLSHVDSWIDEVPSLREFVGGVE